MDIKPISRVAVLFRTAYAVGGVVIKCQSFAAGQHYEVAAAAATDKVTDVCMCLLLRLIADGVIPISGAHLGYYSYYTQALYTHTPDAVRSRPN